MIIWYKNSFLASVVSILGAVLAIAAIAGAAEGEVAALVCIIPGVAMMIWAKKISDDKAFKKWWKQVEDNNLTAAVASDLNTAVAIYNKNPQKRTLQKIAELNPDFARRIEQSIAKK